jgi:hypothetical protein
MSTFSKVFLSGAAYGLPIKVHETATAGTTVHTSVNSTTTIDEIWLYAVNTSGTAVKLTIEYGAATAPDSNIELTVPGECGLMLIIPGLILNNAQIVKAFAGTADVIAIHGYVNRIVP